MQSVTVRPAKVAEVFAAPNVDDLLAEYASESSIAGLPAPAANRDIYAKLESTGLMHVIGAFAGEQLAGFLGLVVTVNPHYSQVLAVTESYFVADKYRKAGAGLQLLAVAEALAKQKGAVGILVSAPVESRLARVLPGVGYRETTRAFFRGFA